MEYSYVSIKVADYIVCHNQILNNLTFFNSTLYSEQAPLRDHMKKIASSQNIFRYL